MHANTSLLSATQLVIQLSIIIIASLISKSISNKIKIPHVVGYIITGIILGPFILGKFSVPYWFPHGVFSLVESPIPVSPHLYGLSSIAAIMLLFLSGLETDMALFVKYSFVGSIIGISGLIVSFFGGYIISIVVTNLHPVHPVHLFMGTIATATSVGITTSVLSTNNKVNSPEGVTILSAAVLDDVLGIILLAIVVGLSETLLQHTVFSTELIKKIALTSFKALGLWLGCTSLGIIFSKKFGKGLKTVLKDSTSITVITLGFALLLGGIFEIMGMSMVIGAYIVGLTISNTDLSYMVQEKITPITTLFTPIFFIVTGMIININDILSWDTFFVGSVYALVCILAKVIGTGLPSLLLGFNPLGALRIGIGMVPRGEIALIIAGIAISTGIIDNKIFGTILIMIVITSLIAPFILDKLLQIPKMGTKKVIQDDLLTSEFDFKNETLSKMIVADFLQLLEEERFFTNRIIRKNKNIYHIRKDNIFLTLSQVNNKLLFTSDKESISFVKTAIYEAIVNIAESAHTIKETLIPQNILSSETLSHNDIKLHNFISSSLVSLQIQNNTKEGIIRELCDLLDQDGLLTNKQLFVNEVLEREKTFSTGMQTGIAIPHAKTNCVSAPAIVIGLKPEGVDFDSLDKYPSTIFILIAIPKYSPHLSILTKISTLLNNPEFRHKVLSSKKKIDIIKLFAP